MAGRYPTPDTSYKQSVDLVVATPIGTHQKTSANSLLTLTPPAGSDTIQIQALGQNARYTLDGTTTPVANDTGFVLYAGDNPVVLNVSAAKPLKIIAESAGSVLQYQWLN